MGETKIEARPLARNLSHAKMTALYQRAGLGSPGVSRLERQAGPVGWLALALGSYGTDVVGEAMEQLVEELGALRGALSTLEEDDTAAALIRIEMRLGVVRNMHEALLVAACAEDDQ